MSDRLTDSMTKKSLLEHLVTQQINKVITVQTHNGTAKPERNSREKQRTEQNSREQKRVTAQPTTEAPAAKKPRQTPTVSVATGIFPKNGWEY